VLELALAITNASEAGDSAVLGELERAEACLRDGRIEAARRGDAFWIDEAERLSQELESCRAHHSAVPEIT
jgi:hypothetical protein